jgi:hypothetical protein
LRERPEKRKYTPLCIDILDEFSIFRNKGFVRLRYYNKNEYNVLYYQDNQKIEFHNEKAGERPSLQFIDDE